MQITIDLPPELEQQLVRQAAQENISLQVLILQALQQLRPLGSQKIDVQWPDAILSFEGEPEVPAFESYRAELLPPRDLELF